MRDAPGELERLRRWRASRVHDPSIAPLVAAAAREARQRHQRLGAFIELWERLVPPQLAVRTRVTALRGGVAHVSVDCASTAWELDRTLRGGLETQLRAAYHATLARIRVTVDGAGPR